MIAWRFAELLKWLCKRDAYTYLGSSKMLEPAGETGPNPAKSSKITNFESASKVEHADYQSIHQF